MVAVVQLRVEGFVPVTPGVGSFGHVGYEELIFAHFYYLRYEPVVGVVAFVNVREEGEDIFRCDIVLFAERFEVEVNEFDEGLVQLGENEGVFVVV